MKLPRNIRLYAVCLIFGIAICAFLLLYGAPLRSSKPQLPSSIFFIANGDLDAVLKKARSNDLTAIRRLIDHYERLGGHVPDAEVWRERARSLGDPTELRLYASELYMRARYSSADAKEKESILIAAKESANLSQKSEDSDAIRKLIGTIQAELDQIHQLKGVDPKGR